MKITILNGDMSAKTGGLSKHLADLVQALEKENEITVFPLSKMNLHYCTGCWDCWWKTPGQCKLTDDGEQIFRSVINSDFFIFASPLMAGFTSSVLKKITDRLIVLIHPYLEIRNGESHHRKRYKRYPEFGVIVEKEDDTDDEDLQINKDIYDRLAVNFHSRQKYFKIIIRENIEEIVHETCHI